MLTISSYEALGGLEGALGRRAEEVFRTQPAGSQAKLPTLLRALVTVSLDGKTTSRWAPRSTFAADTAWRSLIDALLDPEAGLLVAAGSSFEGSRVRLSHEVLLTHWQRARDQIAADARDLELRRRLEHAAGRWRAAAPEDRSSLVLPAGVPLSEALGLARRLKTELPADVVAFIAHSRMIVQRQWGLLALTLTGAVAAVPLVAGLVWAALVWWMRGR